MPTNNIEDYLQHHGIKGMKWGVIRTDEEIKSDSSSSESSRHPVTKIPSFDEMLSGFDTGSHPNVTVTPDGALDVSGGSIEDLEDDVFDEVLDIYGNTDMSPEEKNEAIKLLTEKGIDAVRKKFGGEYIKKEGEGFSFNPGKFFKAATDKIGDTVNGAKSSAKKALDYVKDRAITTDRTITSSPRYNNKNGKWEYKVRKERRSGTGRLIWGETEIHEQKREAEHSNSIEDYLQHHGIKGMKWGVIRNNPSGSTNSSIGDGSTEKHQVVASKLVSGDKKPKDPDTPINKDDILYDYFSTSGKNGEIHNAAAYGTKVKIGSGEPIDVEYHKFDTGEKRFHIEGSSSEQVSTYYVVDTKGRVHEIPSNESMTWMKAYGGNGKREVKHTESGEGCLEHHGIKGMKWGVRRSEAQLARGRGKSSSESSGEVETSKPKKASSESSSSSSSTSTKSKMSDWSDEELSRRLRRAQMETQYANLTAPKKAPESFVKSLLKEQGKKMAKEYLAKGAEKGAEMLLEYMMGEVASKAAIKGKHAKK